MSYDYSSSKAREDFASRLAEVCQDMGIPEHGRQTRLAELFKLTQRGVKRWFDGESFPGVDKAVSIATWANVNFEWLMTGRGTKKRDNTMLNEMRNILEILHNIPDGPKQDVLEFIQYRVERADPPFASDKAARYVKMIEGIKADLIAKRKAPSQ